MTFALLNLVIAVALFFGMLAFQEYGRRLGERHFRDLHEKTGVGPAEPAIFALLGLFLAFTFSDAGSRFDSRRQLIVEETNAIGTAWLRLDLLPPDRQPPMRDLFRQYLDARLDVYRAPADAAATNAANAHVADLQDQIWRAALSAAEASGTLPPFTVLVPAINSMFDVATARLAVTRMQTPLEVFIVIGMLALVSSILVGYSLAGRKTRGWLHNIGFAAVLSMALYLIIDFEYPRVGFIRLDRTDQLLVDLRRSMK
jgi:hypothetical protein